MQTTMRTQPRQATWTTHSTTAQLTTALSKHTLRHGLRLSASAYLFASMPLEIGAVIRFLTRRNQVDDAVQDAFQIVAGQRAAFNHRNWTRLRCAANRVFQSQH